jgi:hypothetical protein
MSSLEVVFLKPLSCMPMQQLGVIFIKCLNANFMKELLVIFASFSQNSCNLDIYLSSHKVIKSCPFCSNLHMSFSFGYNLVDVNCKHSWHICKWKMLNIRIIINHAGVQIICCGICAQIWCMVEKPQKIDYNFTFLTSNFEH